MTDFYTRTGDDGTSGLLGSERVPKDHPRLEAVGSIDEANAALGVARAFCGQAKTNGTLLTIQRDLYNMMAEVAATPENAARFRTIDAHRVAWLEAEMDWVGDNIEIPKDFIVPGDSKVGAYLDLARTIVRRAERRVSTLVHKGELENPQILPYLNRLSSLCFIFELWETLTSTENQISLAKDSDT